MKTMLKTILIIILIFTPFTASAQENLTPERKFELAKNYMFGENGYEKDIDLGAIYLMSAAEDGNAEAQYLLGIICIANEDEDPEAVQTGVEYIRMAAEQELPEAMLLLGKCYEEGFGVEKDLNKAILWLEKAKKAGTDMGSLNENIQNEDNSEYYSVQTTRNVNFRERPSTSDKIIRLLPKGTWLLIDKSQLENGYYAAYNPEDGTSGYIHNKYVKLIEKMEVDNDGSLQVVGTINSPYAEISLDNNSNVKTTIKIGRNSYILKPHEKKTITIDEGTYTVMASSPGIKTYIGKDVVKGGNAYEWVFYIEEIRTR